MIFRIAVLSCMEYTWREGDLERMPALIEQISIALKVVSEAIAALASLANSLQYQELLALT